MFDYEKSNRYIGTIAHGLEEEGAKELAELGATQIRPRYRAISFMANSYVMQRITVMNRLFSRILAPLLQCRCSSDDSLYHSATQFVNWAELFGPDQTFSIFANVANSNITHSQYAALKLKDAIADYFRNKYGRRPNVNREIPDVEIGLAIFNNEATISFDIGHGPLFKRGYRIQSVAAPLQETLAAALLRISGWDGEKPLYDPFCGSGTILAEAALQYCHIPPASKQAVWGFQKLPTYRRQEWEKLQSEIKQQIRPLPANLLFGGDISSEAISCAQTNLETVPFGKNIALAQRPFNAVPIENAMIICNPPYGVRLGEVEEAKKLMTEFGDYLKQQCKGTTAWILLADNELVSAIGLKPSRKVVVYNGDIECRFVEIVIH